MYDMYVASPEEKSCHTTPRTLAVLLVLGRAFIVLSHQHTSIPVPLWISCHAGHCCGPRVPWVGSAVNCFLLLAAHTVFSGTVETRL